MPGAPKLQSLLKIYIGQKNQPFIAALECKLLLTQILPSAASAAYIRILLHDLLLFVACFYCICLLQMP